jgi:hypothetical protein
MQSSWVRCSPSKANSLFDVFVVVGGGNLARGAIFVCWLFSDGRRRAEVMELEFGERLLVRFWWRLVETCSTAKKKK